MTEETPAEQRRSLHFRRGAYLLPSMFTIGNMFCGYACIVFAMRGEFHIAAPFIGIAFIMDALDGRVARLMNSTSAFGIQLDSLADVISFGMAPAILSFAWGLHELGRWGWAIAFLFVAAAALRLARFNIQTAAAPDKRYFVGMPSPAAASVPAATVFAWPYQIHDFTMALLVVPVVLVPAVLMVSTVRFRSFKDLNLGWRRSYVPLFIVVVVLAAVAAEPRLMLAVCAYAYLLSAFGGMAMTRVRRKPASVPSP
ncbi:MAG TPA: CDP-diacylglycerol--serine O-phosphatidyltransferase [Vicinamibacterales bacterium]|nr:CDP-diacylglycerol--serine O-phosphatidyltransferase [Vicinamibacterales bacterium]